MVGRQAATARETKFRFVQPRSDSADTLLMSYDGKLLAAKYDHSALDYKFSRVHVARPSNLMWELRPTNPHLAQSAQI